MSDSYMILTGLGALVLVVLFYVALFSRKHALNTYDLEVERVARRRLRNRKFESDVQVRMMELQEEGRLADLKKTPETQGKAGTWKR